MALSRKQLEGLEEILPKGYPSTGGLVVLRDKKSRSRRSGRRRSREKPPLMPWYRLFYS